MNTVQSAYDTTPKSEPEYRLGALGWFTPGNFYAIYTDEKRWVSLGTGATYTSYTSYKNHRPVKVLPPGTVVTLKVDNE